MNRNQRIVVSIVGIIIVTLALIGITYAYFMTKIIGNSTSTSISGTLANLELTYGDEDGVITKTNMMPGDKIVKKFTVENTGSVKVENYAVIFENLTNTLTRKDDLVYTLTCESDDDNPCDGVVDAIFPSTSGPIILNSIEPSVTHSYTLTVTYKNLNNMDQSADMGKKFEAKVNINDGKNVSYFDIPYTIAYNVINNAKSEKNGTTYSKDPITVPGTEFNNKEEKVLSEKEDDYGISYYYRGDVTDNYLTFNKMCWRIVRIEGDGSTKIILEDSAGPCSLNSRKNYSIGTGAYGNYERRADYANGDSSSMRKQFQSWYTSSGLSNYEEKLKNDKWITGNTSKVYTWEYKENYPNLSDIPTNHESTSVGIFESGHRIKSGESPLLKTSAQDNYVLDYVGTLTADEVLLAGAIYQASEETTTINYLYNVNTIWWTLTISSSFWYGGSGPWDYDTVFAFPHTNWGENYKNYLRVENNYTDYNFRPAIVLKPNVPILGQGTKADPYIVK